MRYCTPLPLVPNNKQNREQDLGAHRESSNYTTRLFLAESVTFGCSPQPWRPTNVSVPVLVTSRLISVFVISRGFRCHILRVFSGIIKCSIPVCSSKWTLLWPSSEPWIVFFQATLLVNFRYEEYILNVWNNHILVLFFGASGWTANFKSRVPCSLLRRSHKAKAGSFEFLSTV